MWHNKSNVQLVIMTLKLSLEHKIAAPNELKSHSITLAKNENIVILLITLSLKKKRFTMKDILSRFIVMSYSCNFNNSK